MNYVCALGEAFRHFASDHAQWSDQTFGTHKNPVPALHHLKKEVDEAITHPRDESEYADMFILLWDAWRRSGNRTIGDLIIAAQAKLEVNKLRKWNAPDENGVCQHVEGT